MKIWKNIITCLLIMLPGPVWAVRYIELYKGLPDYDKEPVFTVVAPSEHKNLQLGMTGVQPHTGQCKMGDLGIWIGEGLNIDITSNICDNNSFHKIRALVKNLAPRLDLSRITLFATNIDKNNDPDLLVGYFDIANDNDAPYPYLSIWRLKFKNGMYKAIYAGPFLNGKFHAARVFGTIKGRKIVFVQHLSCLECEPIVYLTAIDFDARDDAQAYEFTYADNHMNFTPTIEYELPGMGHTIDAKVETRVLPPSEGGPHLLQLFDVTEGEGVDEWWAFTCKGYRCDYKIYKDKAPPEFIILWEKAKRL